MSAPSRAACAARRTSTGSAAAMSPAALAAPILSASAAMRAPPPLTICPAAPELARRRIASETGAVARAPAAP